MSEELESSLKSPLGQLEEIKRCKQHPDLILSGRHRFKYLNMQGKTPQARFIDCEELAKKLDVKHELVHWLVIRASNIRRVVPEEEQKADVLQMASILERDGIAPAFRAAQISWLTGLSLRRIQQLLPPEHKREYDKSETVSQLHTVESGSYGMPVESAYATQGEPAGPLASTATLAGKGELLAMKQSADKGRFSEDASKHRIRAYTEAEQLFAGNLSYYNIEYRTQEVFERPMGPGESEEAKASIPSIASDNDNEGLMPRLHHGPRNYIADLSKVYIADFYLPKYNVIIELEGEGSASSNNEPRDAYFAAQGIKVAHLPNLLAKKYGAQIAELIAVLIK